MNHDGSLFFTADIGSAGGSSLRSGLWEYNNGDLLQLLSVGDEIQVETELGTSEKTISAINWSPIEGVDREHRQLAVGLSFVEGGSGVFLIVPLDDSIIPGDFNRDGAVDAADFVEWRKTDGTPAGYNIWRSHFGQTAGSGAGANANATVPNRQRW